MYFIYCLYFNPFVGLSSTIVGGDSRNLGEPGQNFGEKFINPTSEYNNI
jgi:hypothetical protein